MTTKKSTRPATGSRSPSWLPWVGLLIVGFASSLHALWGLTEEAPDRDRSPRAEVAPAIRALEDELAVLRSRVAALEARRLLLPPSNLAERTGGSETSARPTAPSDASAPPSASFDPEESLAVDLATSEGEAARSRALYEDQLEAETLDATWAQERETELCAALDGGTLGSGYLVGADCRASMCRVELEHPEAGALDEMTIELLARPAFAGRRVFTQADPDRPGRLILFVARLGHALPGDPSAPARL